MTTTKTNNNNQKGNTMNNSFVLNSAIISSTLAGEVKDKIKILEAEYCNKMYNNKGVLETWMEGSDKWTAFSEAKVLLHSLASTSNFKHIAFKDFKYIKSFDQLLVYLYKDGNENSHPKTIGKDCYDITLYDVMNNTNVEAFRVLKNASVDVRTIIKKTEDGSYIIKDRLYTTTDNGEVYIVAFEDINYITMD